MNMNKVSVDLASGPDVSVVIVVDGKTGKMVSEDEARKLLQVVEDTSIRNVNEYRITKTSHSATLAIAALMAFGGKSFSRRSGESHESRMQRIKVNTVQLNPSVPGRRAKRRQRHKLKGCK